MSSRGGLLIALSLLAALPGALPARAQATKPQAVVRLHIVANSQSAADIAAKLAVRDALLGYLRSRLDQESSAAAAEQELGRLVPALQLLANRTLEGYGVPYRAEVALGRATEGPRRYLGARLPAGRYVTLLVRLGAAKGQNWWCLLFPQLCFGDPGAAVDYSEGQAPPPSEFLAFGSGERAPAAPLPLRPGGLIWSFWRLFHSERARGGR